MICDSNVKVSEETFMSSAISTKGDNLNDCLPKEIFY